MSAGWRLRRADELEPDVLREAAVAAFADYLIGPLQLDDEGWRRFLLRQGVDFALSAAMVDDDGAVQAFALIGRVGQRSRLATMGARPAARGSGAARALLATVIDAARRRGDASLELEVFAQNLRALALHRRFGFEERGRLCGYEAPSASTDRAVPAPRAVTVEEAIDRLRADADEQLPYQVSSAGLAEAAKTPPPPQCWRIERAQLVFRARSKQVDVLSLFDPEPGQPGARALARALRAAHPDRPIRVPQLQRPEVGGDALLAEGWATMPLHQLWLRLSLAD